MHICTLVGFFLLLFPIFSLFIVLPLLRPPSPSLPLLPPLLSPPPLLLSHSPPTPLLSPCIYLFRNACAVKGESKTALRTRTAKATLKFQLSSKDVKAGLGVPLFPLCSSEIDSVTNFCDSEIPLFRTSWG